MMMNLGLIDDICVKSVCFDVLNVGLFVWDNCCVLWDVYDLKLKFQICVLRNGDEHHRG